MSLYLYILLLLATFFFVSTSSFNLEKKKVNDEVEHTAVLIIGGGMAGVSAANTLSLSGVTDFILIESQERIGGRMTQAVFNNNYTVELGPMWIQEINLPEGNIIWDLHYQLTPPLTGAFSSFVNATVFDEGIHLNLTEQIKVQFRAIRFLGEIFLLAKEMKKKNARDISIGAALSLVGWEPLNSAEAVSMFALTQLSLADDINNLSLYNFFYLVDEEGNGEKKSQSQPGWVLAYASSRNFIQAALKAVSIFNEKKEHVTLEDFKMIDKILNAQKTDGSTNNWLVIDKRGYVEIANYIAKSFLVDNDPRLRLSTIVKSVDYSDSSLPITVTLTNGHVITADRVICTVSMGVLKASLAISSLNNNKLLSGRSESDGGGIVFTPNFTLEWQRALSHLDMGIFLKLFIQFPTHFWAEHTQLMLRGSANLTYASYFNFDTMGFPTDSHILCVVVVGSEAKRVELMAEADIRADIMSALKTMFTDIPDPIGEVLWKAWGVDPNFLGTYSGRLPGFDMNDFNAIKTPLAGANGEGLVHFAGEAYILANYGYVHSAYYSGQETAGNVIASMSSQKAVF